MKRVILTWLLGTFAFSAVLSDAGDAKAQAWIRDPGSAFVQLNYRLIRSERIYGPNGSINDTRPYRQHAVGLYAETGVVNRWLMLTVDGELFRRNVLPEQGAVSGLGDLGIGAWTGILEAPFRLSFGVHVGIPTGDVDPDAPEGGPQNVADVLPTGDGEVDVALRLAAGHGFGWRKVHQYVLADAGYVIRTTPRDAPGDLTPGDIRDQFSWRIETGIRVDRPFIERFWFVLRVGGLIIVQDRNQDTAAGGPPRFAGLGDGVEYTSFGAEISFRMVPGWSVSFGMDGAFAARNVPAAPAWKLGLSYELE